MEILNYAGNILHYAVSFFVIISIIVFVHEFGHFYIARRCGVKIDDFSIGFGPEIRGWTDKHGTRWKVCLLPFGGFVKMHGDASEASTPDLKKLDTMSEKEKKISFHYKPLWQKFIVVLAGPVFNFIFSVLVFTTIFMAYGKLTLDAPPIVNEVYKGSAAEKIGLKTGDVILSLDGKKIEKFTDLQDVIRMAPLETIDISYKRGEKVINDKITPKFEEIDDGNGNKVKIGMIGVARAALEVKDTDFKHLGPIDAVKEAVTAVYKQARDMLKGLRQIATGVRSTKELGGPVKILEYSGQSTSKISDAIICEFSASGKDCGKMARDGIIISAVFMAMISTMLGLVNLFPIPMLDGGHLMFYIIEGLMRKPVHEKAQALLFRFGFGFLISLMVYATYNDIVSFVQKHISS